MDEPESSFARVLLIATETEDENFQQIVSLSSKREEFSPLFVLRKPVLDLTNTKDFFEVSYEKYLQQFTVYHSSFFSSQDELEHVEKRNLFLKLQSILGLCHVVVKTPKTSPEELTLTLVETQPLPDIR